MMSNPNNVQDDVEKNLIPSNQVGGDSLLFLVFGVVLGVLAICCWRGQTVNEIALRVRASVGLVVFNEIGLMDRSERFVLDDSVDHDVQAVLLRHAEPLFEAMKFTVLPSLYLTMEGIAILWDEYPSVHHDFVALVLGSLREGVNSIPNEASGIGRNERGDASPGVSYLPMKDFGFIGWIKAFHVRSDRYPGAFRINKSLSVQSGGSGVLGGGEGQFLQVPGMLAHQYRLPNYYPTSYGSDNDHQPIGPFEGCVPPKRLIVAFGGCMCGAAVGFVGILRGRGRLALVGWLIFVAASFIWLTGHTDGHECGNSENRQSFEHGLS
jgi:hypothetical protein